MRKFLVLLFALVMVAAPATSALAEGPQDTYKILSPADGAVVAGPDVTITVDPGQIKVTKPGAVVPGEGHWHFFADGTEVGKGPVNSFTFKGLTVGQHTLGVELHQGDHSRYPGDTGREITVTVGLPRTGSGLALSAGLGLGLLLLGGYLFSRSRRGAAVRP
ncbi:MAG: LPXTG cell wall anchor domain-containing protein [Bacillota bacterium]